MTAPVERQPRPPTVEDIDAVSDEATLEAMLEALLQRILQMETDLRFKTDGRTQEWERRALAALGFTKAAKETVRKRIHLLFGAARHAEAQARYLEGAVQRRLMQEALAAERARVGVSGSVLRKERGEAQRFQKLHEMEAARVKLERQRLTVMEGELAHFRKAAKALLDAETFDRITEAASAQVAP
jgi:hypothetical protein